MKRTVFCLLMAAALIAGTRAAHATVTTYNFDTDQSAQFTKVEYLGPDSTANWSYDYSTHVQVAPAINVPIPSAPRSTGGTTRGVQILVNNSIGAINSITLYPNIAAIPPGTNWQMTFDMWVNHNGDAGGATGSTQFVGWGGAADALSPGIGTDGTNGFNYHITGDAGAAIDCRYADGSPLVLDNAKPAWFGDPAATDMASPLWTAFFPNDGTNGTPPTGAVDPGAPGKQWVTVRLTVTNNGADREVAFKRVTDANFTVVSTITGGLGGAARPCVGYGDYFVSIGNPQADQFVVFDNLVVNDNFATTVEDWQLY